MLKPYKLTVAETSAFLRRVARRVCHALSPIANITTGVLLANSKFDEASLTLLAALSVSVLIGYLENDFSQEQALTVASASADLPLPVPSCQGPTRYGSGSGRCRPTDNDLWQPPHPNLIHTHDRVRSSRPVRAGQAAADPSAIGDRPVPATVSKFDIPEKEVAAFCRRHHIRRLALFGSVLRDDFQPDSDVDVLVEFEPGHVPGYAFFAMQDELSEILGRRADLNTPAFLSRYFRDEVLAEAEVRFDASQR